MIYRNFYDLKGNILSVVALEDKASILVSVDNIHEAGSKDTMRTENSQEAVHRLQTLSFAAGSEESPHKQDADLASVSEIISRDESMDVEGMREDVFSWQKALSELLYNLEHMRKRPTEE